MNKRAEHVIALGNENIDMTEKSTYFNTFHSILFERPDDRIGSDALKVPDFFGDLNCNQIVDSITGGKEYEEYNLKPFFYAPLRRIDAIKYRHEVMQDLDDPSIFERVNIFAKEMCEMRRHLKLSQKMSYKEHKQSWFLDAVEIYCDAVSSFMEDLFSLNLKSRGFLRFRAYIKDYSNSAHFTSLLSETKKLKADLAAIRYCILLQEGGCFTIRNYESESDYSVEVEKIFAKFKQSPVRDYKTKTPDDNGEGMNHIEAKILEFVNKLHPEIFVHLDEYCARNTNFTNETIITFDREVQFYIAYLNYITDLKKAKLQFCYPHVSDKSREVFNHDGFDVALADKIVRYHSGHVVCNSFHLEGKERILVISGPNQGGKTTFARMFGQLHYLASIGCPVPGSKAQLFLFDNLFTHFEREEKVENLRGKLEDDLVRIHRILSQATSRSIIVVNEIFTSTTLHDEIFLSTKLMKKISELDVLCTWVTFIDELASFGPQTVSMVSTVDPENPAIRTFKIVRRPADGLAYAMAIAHKYQLTYELIKKRIKP
jgi:DNA mismatch repair ATPase MutS